MSRKACPSSQHSCRPVDAAHSQLLQPGVSGRPADSTPWMTIMSYKALLRALHQPLFDRFGFCSALTCIFAHLPGVKLEQCAPSFLQHARMLWRVADLGHVHGGVHVSSSPRGKLRCRQELPGQELSWRSFNKDAD